MDSMGGQKGHRTHSAQPNIYIYMCIYAGV